LISGAAVKTEMVSDTLEKLPALTKAERVKVKAQDARPGCGIDTSDISEMTDEQWKGASRGRFPRPHGTIVL